MLKIAITLAPQVDCCEGALHILCCHAVWLPKKSSIDTCLAIMMPNDIFELILNGRHLGLTHPSFDCPVPEGFRFPSFDCPVPGGFRFPLEKKDLRLCWSAGGADKSIGSSEPKEWSLLGVAESLANDSCMSSRSLVDELGKPFWAAESSPVSNGDFGSLYKHVIRCNST